MAIWDQMAKSIVKKNDVLKHVDFGIVTVIKVTKSGAVIVKCHDDGIEGTCSIYSLRKII